MKSYSHFFQTLHDETGPTGDLGRGTHYSVLRAVVWHDEYGNILKEARYHDFSIIWDEDHDERVMRAVEKIYNRGLLPALVFIGERKGGLTVLLKDAVMKKMNAPYLSGLRSIIDEIGQSLADPWTSNVSIASNGDGIISDANAKVELYLANILMLWNLGPKAITYPSAMAEAA